MRSIAILNQKGGVGKTTTAVNLSAALATAGQRVLLLDLDPQAHATLHLGVSPSPGDCTIYDVLTGDATLADAQRPITENLSLVGSHIDLAAAELELASVVGREVILRDKLRPVAAGPDGHGNAAIAWDYVIVDCPPSLGVLAINALSAVNEVFIPLQPHFLALHGLGKLLETIDLVARRLNHGLRASGIVFCMYESGTRLAAEVTHDVDEFLAQSRGHATPWSDARVFHTRIRRNIRLAEAPSFGQSIFQYAADSHGADDYRAMAIEVMGDALGPSGARRDIEIGSPKQPNPDEPVDLHKAFEEGTLIDEAMIEAVQDVVQRHREAGLPLAIWRNGRVEYVSPFDGSVVDPP